MPDDARNDDARNDDARNDNARNDDARKSGGDEGSGRATAAALAANLGVAAAKFIAFAFTGSSAMLAEAGHSIADSSNQVLMFVGRRQSRSAPSGHHPFGFGGARYMSAFVVSIVLFVAGGLFGIYEGYQKITNPHPLETWYWAVGVLVVAFTLEAFSLRTAVRASRPHRGRRSWPAFVRRVRIPELPVVLLEDTAALIGLTFALAGVVASTITGDPVYDGIGSMAIGVLLVVVAAVLAAETGSMVLGEAATDEDLKKIRNALLADGPIEDVLELRTMHLGPDDLLVVGKVGVAETDASRLAGVLEDAERRVKDALPTVRAIYVQPAATGRRDRTHTATVSAERRDATG